MRRPRSRSRPDLDAVDVLLVEDDEWEGESADGARSVLQQLAVEAERRRATSPGDPRPLPDATAGPESSADGSDSADSGARSRTAPWRRRQAAVPAAAAAVALAVAIAGGVTDARQAAERRDTLLASPGVLAEVAQPPVEAWRLPGRMIGDRPDRLLVVDDATRTLRAADPATGRVLWTATPEAGHAASAGRCLGPDDGVPADLIICAATLDPPGEPTPDGTAPVTTRLVAVDVTTGEARWTATTDGDLLAAQPVDDGLVVVTRLRDGRARIGRWHLEDGAAGWLRIGVSHTGRGGAVGPVHHRAGSLTIGQLSVDVRTGERLDADEALLAPLPPEVHTLPGEAVATWAWYSDGPRGRGHVARGEGRRFMLPGPPLRPAVTDHSDDGTLVVRTARGDRLRGMDLRNGRMRWSRPWPGAATLRPAALVEGVLLLDDGATVTALAVATGETLWQVAVDPAVTARPALTDGDVVVLPERTVGGEQVLVARGLVDGTAAWRVPAPTGTVALAVVGQCLVATTSTPSGDQVVGLR